MSDLVLFFLSVMFIVMSISVSVTLSALCIMLVKGLYEERKKPREAIDER
jgi:hypothetical protein